MPRSLKPANKLKIKKERFCFKHLFSHVLPTVLDIIVVGMKKTYLEDVSKNK